MGTPILSLASAPPKGRVNRNPVFPSYTRYIPHLITPFMYAPVLPGETLTNLSFEARTISQGIKHPLIGWSAHFYWFYVKLMDLENDVAIDAQDLLLDPTNTPHVYLEQGGVLPDNVGSSVFFQRAATKGYNWLPDCYRRIVETWFRHDSQPLGATNYGLFTQNDRNLGIFDSATLATVLEGGAAKTTVGDQARSLEMFEYLQAMQMIDMDYSEFIASYGVTISREITREPELLHQSSDWSYPANSVVGDGSVKSVVSWVNRTTYSKPKFFKEPGFIVGLAVIRPKTYRGDQLASANLVLDRSTAFMPGLLADMPETSLMEINPSHYGLGPDQNWFLDVRDLYLYGDQFCNVTPPHATATPAPGPDVEGGFGTSGYFVDDQKTYVDSDGVTRLTIKGRQRDYTTARR